MEPFPLNIIQCLTRERRYKLKRKKKKKRKKKEFNRQIRYIGRRNNNSTWLYKLFVRFRGLD